MPSPPSEECDRHPPDIPMMTAVPVAERLTAEQFLALPVPQRGRPGNLIAGEVVMSEPTALHGEVVQNLLFALESWARAEYLAL